MNINNCCFVIFGLIWIGAVDTPECSAKGNRNLTGSTMINANSRWKKYN